MRHLSLPHHPPRRSAARRAVASHRSWNRMNRDRRELRASDIVLALLGLSLVGALCLMAAVNLLGRTLAS